MTIQLLTDYPFGRYTIPAGRVVNVFNSATEAGLIASKQAIASAAAATWTPPDETPIYDQLTPAEVQKLRPLVSEAGNVDSYSDDTWIDVPATTGLVIPLPVFVKAVRLLGGTSPTLVLRDALVDTYTAASSSTDVPFDSTVTPATLGAEIPLNRYFRMGVHATPGGTAPRWAIKV